MIINLAGVGGAVGGVVGSAVNNAFESVNNQPQQADDMAAFKAKIDKLTMMKEAEMLSDEEFNNMKTQLLASIM